MFDFSVIQKTDISPAEFAALIRYKDDNNESRSITRATAWKWISGKREPTKELQLKVSKVLFLLNESFNAGDLPLKLGTPRAERKHLIAVAVGKHLPKITG